MKAKATNSRSWWSLQLILLPVCPALCWCIAKRPSTLVSRHASCCGTKFASRLCWNERLNFRPRHSLLAHIEVENAEESVSEEENAEPAPSLRELYPPSAAYENGTLEVDSIHTLYYEVHGTKPKQERTGKSALFLHGGPGAGCTPTHARFFDPDQYDTIVLFDQRGCGRSTPRGNVFNNTIWYLIQDCEQLRQHTLGTEGKWDVVLGGSWGSTLAVAYAQEYPTQIRSLILRGVCLLRPSEVDWLFAPEGGAAKGNPKAWQSFAKNVGVGPKPPPAIAAMGPDVPFANDAAQTIGSSSTGVDSTGVDVDRNVLHRYYDRFFGLDTTDRWNAARGWMGWEYTVSSSYKKLQQAEKKGGNQSNAAMPTSPAVLVSACNSPSWEYEDICGMKLQPSDIESLSLNPASETSLELRQGLPPTNHQPAPARPIGMDVQGFEKAQDEKFGNFSGLPAMPMLTCFYSVNDHYAMNGWNLLDRERMQRIRHIPCIAVQGGRDPICPPDTALDVLQIWPEMELRIPLLAGHSMYHPELAHELVQATDRMAQ